jgi:hypothetical protein
MLRQDTLYYPRSGCHRLVWWFRSPPYRGSAAAADFGTINHTGKQCFASVLIGSEVRKAANHSTVNFRTGTLD